MKKYLRYTDSIILLAGALGLLLQCWLQWVGEDRKGLYPSGHISMILLTLLSMGVVVVFFLIGRHAGRYREYEHNFPASLQAAVGSFAAAVGIGIYAVKQFGGEGFLPVAVALSGLAAGAVLIWGGYYRMKGRKPHFLVHLIPCAFFMLRLFLMARDLGDEPEASRYLVRFLAAILMIPASYQLWGFDVGEGNRNKCLFWCACAGYFALIAMAGGNELLLHMTLALWMVTGLPLLQYLPRRPVREREAEPVSETVIRETVVEEVPVPMAEPAEAPEKVAEEVPQPSKQEKPAPAEAEEAFDPDQFLEELFREIDSKLDQNP